MKLGVAAQRVDCMTVYIQDYMTVVTLKMHQYAVQGEYILLIRSTIILLHHMLG